MCGYRVPKNVSTSMLLTYYILACSFQLHPRGIQVDAVWCRFRDGNDRRGFVAMLTHSMLISECRSSLNHPASDSSNALIQGRRIKNTYVDYFTQTLSMMPIGLQTISRDQNDIVIEISSLTAFTF